MIDVPHLIQSVLQAEYVKRPTEKLFGALVGVQRWVQSLPQQRQDVDAIEEKLRSLDLSGRRCSPMEVGGAMGEDEVDGLLAFVDGLVKDRK